MRIHTANRRSGRYVRSYYRTPQMRALQRTCERMNTMIRLTFIPCMLAMNKALQAFAAVIGQWAVDRQEKLLAACQEIKAAYPEEFSPDALRKDGE